MDAAKLRSLIESGKNLGSCSEMCAVACATGDISKAPEPYNSDINAAWDRLSTSQRETVNAYRREKGFPALNESRETRY